MKRLFSMLLAAVLAIRLSDMDNVNLAKPEIYTGTVYPAREGFFAAGSPIRSAAVVLPLGVILLTGAMLLFWPKKKKDPAK